MITVDAERFAVDQSSKINRKMHYLFRHFWGGLPAVPDHWKCLSWPIFDTHRVLLDIICSWLHLVHFPADLSQLKESGTFGGLARVPHHGKCLSWPISDCWGGADNILQFILLGSLSSWSSQYGRCGSLCVSVEGTLPLKMSGNAHSWYLGWYWTFCN